MLGVLQISIHCILIIMLTLYIVILWVLWWSYSSYSEGAKKSIWQLSWSSGCEEKHLVHVWVTLWGIGTCKHGILASTGEVLTLLFLVSWHFLLKPFKLAYLLNGFPGTPQLGWVYLLSLHTSHCVLVEINCWSFPIVMLAILLRIYTHVHVAAAAEVTARIQIFWCTPEQWEKGMLYDSVLSGDGKQEASILLIAKVHEGYLLAFLQVPAYKCMCHICSNGYVCFEPWNFLYL